ncbi:restriction endonuclease subunit S, partial [Thiolapillus sp.]|uniref:restriction endonuclease subunit S n=1 Tax=Thiolapillus sp. TaxID=2017437 RepID=UPI003AF6316A
MRSKSDKKKPLVPSLRFPEFREAGAWEVKRLGGIGSVSMCKRILKSQTSESGDIPFYKIGTFSKQADAFIENKIYEEFKEKYSFPNKGDILISASGTIGRTVVYDGKPAYFQDSNIVWIANNENILLNAFLYYCYKTIQWQTDDNTISRLYNDNLRKMKIVVPPIPEQQKIAHCLSSLDEVIGLQAKKVQALKRHKKGLMQQLFPAEGETTPRLRFPEFREAGAWEVKRLGEVCCFLKGKGLPKTAITPHGVAPCIHYGELFTDYGEVIRDTKSYTDSTNNCVKSEEEDVLMPTSDVTPNGLAKASCIKEKGVVLGGDILIIRANKQ